MREVTQPPRRNSELIYPNQEVAGAREHHFRNISSAYFHVRRFALSPLPRWLEQNIEGVCNLDVLYAIAVDRLIRRTIYLEVTRTHDIHEELCIPILFPRIFAGSDRFPVHQSDRVRVARPRPVRFEDLLTRPDPAREFSETPWPQSAQPMRFWTPRDPTRGSGHDPGKCLVFITMFWSWLLCYGAIVS